MNSDADASVKVTQAFDAAPGEVFDAWTNPDEIGNWMFGPTVRDEELLHVWIDAKPGGTFSFLVRRDGREIDHSGTYLEVSRPERLVFTWGTTGEAENDSRVYIDIVPKNGGCELSLTHLLPPESADYAKSIEGSWMLMLSTLHTRTLSR